MGKTIKKKPTRKNSWLLRLLRREKSPGSTAFSDETNSVSLNELRAKGRVVEISDKDTYGMVVGDENRDVMVEFFDNKALSSPAIPTNLKIQDCETVHKVCIQLGEEYRNSDQLTIARCHINAFPVENVYSIPTIKLYPAHHKTLPVEFLPDDYSCAEGYRKFIKEEGTHRLDWESTTAPIATM